MLTQAFMLERTMPKTKRDGTTKKPARKRSKNNTRSPQTNEPYEQSLKRPIGQHGAVGRPPLIKK